MSSRFCNIYITTNTGLNYRSMYIREGCNKINTNNIGGVFYEGEATPRWEAQWNDVNGTMCSKSFTISKWGHNSYFLACD